MLWAWTHDERYDMALIYDDGRTKRTRWHTVNEYAARQLTTTTNSPGVVYGRPTTELPDQLKLIPGVASYHLIRYGSPQVLEDGRTVGGELLVTRVESETAKNYLYPFAASSGGTAYTGPYKGFCGHHVVSGQNIPVNSLFGHTPFSR